jgi:hypothetical protein
MRLSPMNPRFKNDNKSGLDACWRHNFRWATYRPAIHEANATQHSVNFSERLLTEKRRR